MSAYLSLPTPMMDLECLLNSLEDVGFSRRQIEVHQQPVSLVGYDSSARGRVAQVVIRRQFVGQSSNDIGFEETPTGFKAHVSDFDQSRFGPAWLARLHQRYQIHDQARVAQLAAEEAQRQEEARQRLVESQRLVVLENAKRHGYLVEESRRDGKIRLVLVKRVY
jgi:hypothetical protein